VNEYRFEWRGPFSNEAMSNLHAEAFGHPVADHDWQRQFRRHSLGWACAFDSESRLVGAVNVPWDGGFHAFVMDTAVARSARRERVGTRLVSMAVEQARAAGCEWLHVDFDGEALSRFYFECCGFMSTIGGLIRLND
jgi:GNAT superfamily N-acetyltransferase